MHNYIKKPFQTLVTINVLSRMIFYPVSVRYSRIPIIPVLQSSANNSFIITDPIQVVISSTTMDPDISKMSHEEES